MNCTKLPSKNCDDFKQLVRSSLFVNLLNMCEMFVRNVNVEILTKS